MSDIESESNCYATFILRGKGLNPQEVTKSLNIHPSKSFQRGDYRTETDRWKHNFWSFDSKGEVRSEDLSAHIQWLLDQLNPVKDKLVDILKGKDVVAVSEISCLWTLPTSHEGLVLSDEMIGQMASMGIKLNIEVYGPD